MNILVVDDEDSIREVFKEYLQSVKDCNVLTANDGFEALDIIRREEIHCCFTDISMPRMDGIELTDKIQRYDNTIPVVVMTGYPSLDSTIKILKNGVVDFLPKPVKMEQLPITVDRVIRERSLFIENVLLKEEARKNEKIKKINRELKQKIKEVETVNLILKQLDRATTSKDLFSILVNLSAKITTCDESHFYVLGNEMSSPAVIASFFRHNNKDGRGGADMDEDIIRKVANDGVPLIIKKNGVNRSAMAIPLKIKSMVFGVLVSIMTEGDRNFTDKDLYFSNFLAEDASFLVENLALYENIYDNLFSTLYAFVETIEARDPYTKQHSSRVKNYAVLIAEAMNCKQENIDILSVSGYLHDIGKIGVPDKILLKPGDLTAEEYEKIKKHPVIGANIIGHFNMWTDEQKVIKHHHERWDGGGYPDMLKGEEIPLLSRILAVADTFDALTSDRSYRHRLKDADAVHIIKDNSGVQFDPNIVDVFLGLRQEGKIFSQDFMLLAR